MWRDCVSIWVFLQVSQIFQRHKSESVNHVHIFIFHIMWTILRMYSTYPLFMTSHTTRLSTHLNGKKTRIQLIHWCYQRDGLQYTCLNSGCKVLLAIIPLKSLQAIYGWNLRWWLWFFTHIGLVSHICMIKNSSHFHSDTYMHHKSLYFFNSYPPGQNGRHFADNIFRCIFVHVKICILIKISLKFVPKGPIDNNSALVDIMVWRGIGDKPLSEPMLTWFTDAYMWTRGNWVISPRRRLVK